MWREFNLGSVLACHYQRRYQSVTIHETARDYQTLRPQDTSAPRHFGPVRDTSSPVPLRHRIEEKLGHFGLGPEVSGHFGTSFVVPKCLVAEVFGSLGRSPNHPRIENYTITSCRHHITDRTTTTTTATFQFLPAQSEQVASKAGAVLLGLVARQMDGWRARLGLYVSPFTRANYF